MLRSTHPSCLLGLISTILLLSSVVVTVTSVEHEAAIVIEGPVGRIAWVFPNPATDVDTNHSVALYRLNQTRSSDDMGLETNHDFVVGRHLRVAQTASIAELHLGSSASSKVDVMQTLLSLQAQLNQQADSLIAVTQELRQTREEASANATALLKLQGKVEELERHFTEQLHELRHNSTAVTDDLTAELDALTKELQQTKWEASANATALTALRAQVWPADELVVRVGTPSMDAIAAAYSSLQGKVITKPVTIRLCHGLEVGHSFTYTQMGGGQSLTLRSHPQAHLITIEGLTDRPADCRLSFPSMTYNSVDTLSGHTFAVVLQNVQGLTLRGVSLVGPAVAPGEWNGRSDWGGMYVYRSELHYSSLLVTNFHRGIAAVASTLDFEDVSARGNAECKQHRAANTVLVLDFTAVAYSSPLSVTGAAVHAGGMSRLFMACTVVKGKLLDPIYLSERSTAFLPGLSYTEEASHQFHIASDSWVLDGTDSGRLDSTSLNTSLPMAGVKWGEASQGNGCISRSTFLRTQPTTTNDCGTASRVYANESVQRLVNQIDALHADEIIDIHSTDVADIVQAYNSLQGKVLTKNVTIRVCPGSEDPGSSNTTKTLQFTSPDPTQLTFQPHAQAHMITIRGNEANPERCVIEWNSASTLTPLLGGNEIAMFNFKGVKGLTLIGLKFVRITPVYGWGNDFARVMDLTDGSVVYFGKLEAEKFWSFANVYASQLLRLGSAEYSHSPYAGWVCGKSPFPNYDALNVTLSYGGPIIYVQNGGFADMSCSTFAAPLAYWTFAVKSGGILYARNSAVNTVGSIVHVSPSGIVVGNVKCPEGLQQSPAGDISGNSNSVTYVQCA